ncbi:alanine racemase [Bacillus sp. DTU_2020_1000418_1_SI_GHA_SEK_038]|uniref:alanine racemase n=1 Tax=Bacillus sp. DTU_2020_1000418_1_SI_GHA_SEK_038 TaxID=3077585 RepID=UPI0028E8CC9A|nr:alanine racemase [Bacillus sp. DTU_2020_1000418_1_SI_GHA_SEK_038]WNS75936.1 alanine racemase [Bacillus sp. DTU_2020_1000418_1_SI_GHA_SEK_038]
MAKVADCQTTFYRDTWAEINLDHISYNVEEMRNHVHADVKIFAVVKANGYGHGDAEVAKAALAAGANYIAVATLDEALSLRKKGISAPILVLGASRPEDAEIAVEQNITLTVFQLDWLEKAKQYVGADRKLMIHLKLDTGMGRIGIRSGKELQEIEAVVAKSHAFHIEGVFTHFATADEMDSAYFTMQLERFKEMVSWLKKKPELIHTSNSAASLRYSEAHLNAVRMGIAMYGLMPSAEMEPTLPFPLKPAFTLHTKIVNVKKVKKGEKISYGATYEAKEDEWIGTLPIGYADGWTRMLQGQDVLIDGKRAPIVGRICMDQCMIKLPSDLPVGTDVTLIGQQGEEKITADDIAKSLGTINYEITCMIGARIPRVYKKNGQVAKIINSLL